MVDERLAAGAELLARLAVTPHRASAAGWIVTGNFVAVRWRLYVAVPHRTDNDLDTAIAVFKIAHDPVYLALATNGLRVIRENDPIADGMRELQPLLRGASGAWFDDIPIGDQHADMAYIYAVPTLAPATTAAV